MTDQPPAEQPIPVKTYDGSIGDLAKSLINDLIEESQKTHGDTPKERIRNHLKFQAGETTLHGITALSSYATSRAEERQAVALESIAKTVSKLQVAESLDTNAQAIVDQRESRRDYLSTTYSLPTETLSLLWALRGLLVDASIKSLSVPSRFDAYQRLSTEELAWSLRISSEEFWCRLPCTTQGAIDFALLEAFDVLHYNGDSERPDVWAYGG